MKGTVVDLAFGGDGVIKDEGHVVFVPFAIPGEDVQYEIIKKKKNFAFGKLLSVDKKSRDRIEPKCPYFGVCGGCQLQHIAYPKQLDFKKKMVEDALKRIGHLFHDVKPFKKSVREWEYRRHVTLSLKVEGDRFKAGYIAQDQQTVIPIDQCVIFINKESPIMKLVQELVSEFEPHSQQHAGRLSIFKLENQQFLLYFYFDQMPANCDAVLKKWSVNPLFSGLFSQGLGYGEPLGYYLIDGMAFQFSPDCFMQNHPEESLNIYKLITSLAKQIAPQSILDLYCGIGISSIFLAKEGFKTHGIEGNPKAIQLAKANSEQLKIQNVTFEEADVNQVTLSSLKKLEPDLVIVNPPRTGLTSTVIEALLQHAPQWIFYISCMPSTMARDLKELCKETYQIKDVELFDMFPQTTHMETVVVLEKKV